jgi:hypothetical protein
VLSPLRANWRALWPLALALLFTYGYFVGPPAWNQNSRLALTRALVEQRTTIIDAYHETTGDKASREGHYYSDKAPGASLLATVPYALFYAARRMTGGELPDVYVQPLDPIDAAMGRAPEPAERKPGDRLFYNQAHKMALYACALGTTALLALAGAAALFLLALRQLAGDRRGALLVTLAYALATPALPYSTVLYGHQLCADLLLIAFAIVVLAPPQATGRAWPLLCGLALGLAVLCEYTAAVPAVMITILAVRGRTWRFAGLVCVGALPCAAILAIYHQVAFGSPFQTGYDFVHLDRFAEGMRAHYGLGPPDVGVLLEILFGSYRGLFYLAPVLLLAVWGLAAQLRHGSAGAGGLGRGPIVLAALVVLYYVLLNSGYYMWDGGAALGPRHCVPMLPFLALGLAPALRAVPRAWIVLAGVSLLQMVIATAAAPEAPQHGNPLWSFALPRLLEGQVANYDGTTNLGLLLGLPGVFSLAPLAALWIWAWSFVRDELRERRRPE